MNRSTSPLIVNDMLAIAYAQLASLHNRNWAFVNRVRLSVTVTSGFLIFWLKESQHPHRRGTFSAIPHQNYDHFDNSPAYQWVSETTVHLVSAAKPMSFSIIALPLLHIFNIAGQLFHHFATPWPIHIRFSVTAWFHPTHSWSHMQLFKHLCT